MWIFSIFNRIQLYLPCTLLIILSRRTLCYIRYYCMKLLANLCLVRLGLKFCSSEKHCCNRAFFSIVLYSNKTFIISLIRLGVLKEGNYTQLLIWNPSIWGVVYLDQPLGVVHFKNWFNVFHTEEKCHIHMT